MVEVADAKPEPFPGFDGLILDYAQLQAVMREHRYASWRTVLSSVVGISLITDTRDGRHDVGKADGAQNILQRWGTYAANGHGGNVELRGLDPSTPTPLVNATEPHDLLRPTARLCAIDPAGCARPGRLRSVRIRQGRQQAAGSTRRRGSLERAGALDGEESPTCD
ncbi:hypothetical protein [Microbacterium sp.]|uniref:hypothetical protein n=1 Tax=Microbacterium sp. TaxID=51671 RepID=UPI0039E32B90